MSSKPPHHSLIRTLIPTLKTLIQVKYPASGPQLPMGLSGSLFSHIFGCNQSMMELLLLKRKIKGPSWLLLRNPTRVALEHQVQHTGGFDGAC